MQDDSFDQETMNDIQRFEKRVLPHAEFDDDEGFDENSPR